MAPSRPGRSLSFAGDLLAGDDASDVDIAPPPRRSLVKVESMVKRRKSAERPSVWHKHIVRALTT